LKNKDGLVANINIQNKVRKNKTSSSDNVRVIKNI